MNKQIHPGWVKIGYQYSDMRIENPLIPEGDE